MRRARLLAQRFRLHQERSPQCTCSKEKSSGTPCPTATSALASAHSSCTCGDGQSCQCAEAPGRVQQLHLAVSGPMTEAMPEIPALDALWKH